MKVVKPIQASPEFIHDNQDNPKYEILYKEDNPEMWEHMIEYHGKERVMCIPSGRECFFSEVL